ncbi:MAG TPA: histidinol-phosphatase [Chryseosolibacter sp.]
MKASLLSIMIVMSLSANSQQKELRWYKGNLHTHSLWSDGDGYPEMIVDWYRSRGYHFVALSDHNILAQGEKWVKVPKSKVYEDAFQHYLTMFGDDWVEQKTDSAGRTLVKLKTYEAYRNRFEHSDFLMLKAEEITDQFEKKPIHINVTNIQDLIPAQGGNSVLEVMQRNIDAVHSQRIATGVPMFAHINHPNFYYAISANDMIALRGERFFEVYNGHPLVHNEGDSLHPGTEELWDQINIAYRKRGQALMYGLATDDSHHYHLFGRTYSNAGRGWVMVRSGSLTPESLVQAMEAGDFYASTGVVLEDLKTDKNTLVIDVKEQKGVSYRIEFIRCEASGEITREVVKGPRASRKLKESDLFLRAKVVSSQQRTNPVNDVEFETAWIQPIIYRSVQK